MAGAVKKVAVPSSKNNRIFVGKLWHNTSKKGLAYDNITFDTGMEVIIRDTKNNVEYSLPAGASIQGFANEQRPGKKDADVRLSFSIEG